MIFVKYFILEVNYDKINDQIKSLQIENGMTLFVKGFFYIPFRYQKVKYLH